MLSSVSATVKAKIWRRLILVGVGIIGLAALLAVSLAWEVIHTISPRTTPADLVEAALDRAPSGSLGWKLAHGGRVNMLLLGYGGAGQDNPRFTDTILVLSLDRSSRRAAMVSLPRFLAVDIPSLPDGSVRAKLETAFSLGGSDASELRRQWQTSTGGGDLAAATVAEFIGQPIDGWVAVRLDAFEALVDGLGSVEVNVPESLTDNSYPSDSGSGTRTVHFDAGLRRMSGAQAEEYARSRLSTSEEDRTLRQQLVFTAVLHRLHQVGPAPLLLIAVAGARNGLLTDLRPAEMRLLYGALNAVDISGARKLSIDESNFVHRVVIGGAADYILVPNASTDASIRKAIASVLNR